MSPSPLSCSPLLCFYLLTAQPRTPGQGFPECCQVPPNALAHRLCSQRGKEGFFQVPVGAGGGRTDRIQGRLSLGWSSMGQEALSCFLSTFFLLYSSRIFKGGNLEPDVPVSRLPVLCITALLICKLGTVFHLVLLCCDPSLRKTLLPRQNASWPPEPQPQEPAGPRVLSSFPPYFFP